MIRYTLHVASDELRTFCIVEGGTKPDSKFRVVLREGLYHHIISRQSRACLLAALREL